MYLRVAVLEKLAREMILQRHDRLHPLRAGLTGGDLAAMHGLLADGVLREDQPSGYAPASAPVAFAHALLFDFTVASQVLARPGEPMHLAGVLAAEPDWALLLRSSLDLHLAALWHGDPARESFFALATTLTMNSPLAASAAAEVPVRERLTLPDLEPLIGRCLGPDATAERRAARTFTSQLLARALHLPDLTGQQAATAMLALASAARRLAQAAEQALDVELATTATVIVNRIRALPGWRPEWPGAADCGIAAAAITRTALADLKGPGHEYLGHRAADLLTDAVRIDPGQNGPLIARFAEPAVMAAWGVSAAGVLTRGFAGIAVHAPGPATDLAVAVWTFNEERVETTSPTPSQIREYFGDRRTDLEGARQDIGTAFPAVLKQNPAAAVEMYLRVIEAAVPPPADGLESVLLSLGGGTLAGKGHGALVTMTSEIAGYLDDLARQSHDPAGGRPADDTVADPLAEVLDRLAGRLRNPEAWSGLLSAGARKPATLGIRLIPALRSGQLLTVGPASQAAVGLIQVVAPLLEDDEHGRLEAAVVSIPAAGYAGHLRDRLLRALDRSRISDPRDMERRAALDAVGGPPPPGGPIPGPARDISLALPGPSRTTRLSQATQAVQESLRGPTSGTNQDQTEAPAIRDRFMALLSHMEQHDQALDRQGRGEYQEALAWAVIAAARLAEDPGTGPGTPVGTAVLSTLLGPLDMRAGRDPAVAGSRPAPEEATMIRAAEGVLALFRRSEWAASPQGAPIETAARELLEHDQPAVRAAAVSALPRILPEPAARYARITELLRAESADFLRARLLQQLYVLLRDMPGEVDRSLAELGTTGAWPALAAVPQDLDDPSADPGGRPGETDFVVQVLIGVALLSGHDRCQRLLATWLDHPAAFCYRAERACLHLRDWLTAGDSEATAIRQAAYALTARPVHAAARLRLSAEATAEGRLAFDRAARVAAMVSRNLKIAADKASEEMPEDFAALAFPVVEQLAQVGTPAVVHDIIHVLKRIAPSDPKRATLTVALAVTIAPSYAREPAGEHAVLDLVDTTVAEHRDLVLGDPEWTSALRQILEAFVAQGVDAVIAKFHDLGDMFR
jgi:hypothetical protein